MRARGAIRLIPGRPRRRFTAAYYSPLPPERSGIADYSALLLPALRTRMDIEVARRRRPPPAADVALYHVGNDPNAHAWIVEALRRRPGVVVLHDLVLHHLVAGMTLARGDVSGYLAAMEREAGLPGRLLALGVVDGSIPPLWEERAQEFPLAGEVLDRATAVIVHSGFVERRVREAGYEGPVVRISMPAWPAPPALRADVGGSPVVGCFGHLNASKRLPVLAAAFSRVRLTHPDARLVLVGPAAPALDVAAILAEFGLDRSPAVLREEYVDEERLWSLMRAVDVCVSLRSPTMGETSGTVVRSLSLGVPLVVSDVGWFSELPPGTALKVPVDEYELDLLVAALELLAADEGTRSALGAAGLDYARRELHPEQAAETYASVLEHAAGDEAAADAVLREVARAAAETGIGPGSSELAQIAARARELGLGAGVR